MKAVVIHAPHDLRIEQIADAPAPAGGEVRVAGMRGGICGSDLHNFNHGGFGSFRFDREFTMAADLIDRGRVDLSPVLTGVCPVDDAVAAFTFACDTSPAMKVQLSFA